MSITPGNGFPVPPVVPGLVGDELADEPRDEALVDREAERDLAADRGEVDQRVARDEVSEQEPAIATLPEDRA